MSSDLLESYRSPAQIKITNEMHSKTIAIGARARIFFSLGI